MINDFLLMTLGNELSTNEENIRIHKIYHIKNKNYFYHTDEAHIVSNLSFYPKTLFPSTPLGCSLGPSNNVIKTKYMTLIYI